MEIDYHAVNLTIHPGGRERVEAELERVSSVLQAFRSPKAHVEIEKSPRKGGIGVSVLIRLPTRSLFATAWGGNLRGAMELAVDKVVRQAKRHVAILRKEERAGAESLRAAAAVRPPSADELSSARDLEEFGDRAADHVARLSHVLRRERRLDPRVRAAGGRISISDIVDEALGYVYEHFREKPSDLTPDRWLVRRGLLVLERELDSVSHVAASSDTPAPDAEPQEVWEEIMDLPIFQAAPLEGRPADDRRSSPERVGSRREAQQATAAALQALPDRERRAITLRHLEGYQVPEIAYVLNASDEQVDQWLLTAETNLQDKLSAWRHA